MNYNFSILKEFLVWQSSMECMGGDLSAVVAYDKMSK